MALGNGGGTSHEKYTADGRDQIGMVGELRAAYRSLAEQQEADYRKTADLINGVSAELVNVKKGAEDAAGGVGGIADEAKKAATSFSGFLAKGAQLGALAFGFEALTGKLGQVKQFLDESSAAMIRNSNLSQGLEIGITGASAAFGGLVTDVELASKANEAFMLGAVQTSTEFTALSAGIATLAAKQGKDATQLLSDGVSALARQSPELLDNIGVTLDAVEAQSIYAKSLGKTTESLSAQEKEAAFTKAALIKISAAAKEAASSNAAAARVYAQSQVALENLRDSALGFDDSVGRAREAVRNLTDEQLRYLENSIYRGADVEDLNKGLRSAAELQAKQTNELLGTNIAAEAFLSTYEDIKALGDVSATVAQENERRRLQGLDAQAAADKAAHEDKIKGTIAEADEAQHMADILEASGAHQMAINNTIREALGLRMEAAKLAGDETEQLRLQRELEVLAAGELAKKKTGGGRRGPTAADRLQSTGDIELDRERDLLKMRQQVADANGEAVDLSAESFDLQRRTLDLEREVLEITKTKGAVEKEQNAARIEQITREQAMIDYDAAIAAREKDMAAREEASSITAALAEQQSQAATNVISLDAYRLEQQAKSLEADGRLGELYAVKLQLIEQESLRVQEQLDLRAELLALENPEGRVEQIQHEAEVAQLAHDQSMAIAAKESATRQAMAAEQQRLFLVEKARKEAAWKQAQTIADQGNRLANAGMALSNFIVDQTTKDEDKRAKAKLRAQGAVTIGIAAGEAVQAAAAYASLNIPQGLAHTAAAVLGFAQGGIMLAGNVPGQGGAASSAAPAEAAPAVERNTSEAARNVDSTVSAADRGPRSIGGAGSGAGKGGTTIILENVYGTVTEEFVEMIALKSKDAAYGNEAAA